MGTSSNCLCTHFLGMFFNVQTMFTTVSGRGSKLAGANLLPKTVVVSWKYLPNQEKP
jgi:hypothetical protein